MSDWQKILIKTIPFDYDPKYTDSILIGLESKSFVDVIYRIMIGMVDIFFIYWTLEYFSYTGGSSLDCLLENQQTINTRGSSDISSRGIISLANRGGSSIFHYSSCIDIISPII